MTVSPSSTAMSDTSQSIAFDANGLSALKQSARDQSPASIKGVAKQFEAIFLNMMLKSMRDATPKEGLFDNEQSRTFTSMLDQQLTQSIASKGLGLSDVLVRQLSQSSQSNPVASSGGADVANPAEQKLGSEQNQTTGVNTKNEAIPSSPQPGNLNSMYANVGMRNSNRFVQPQRATGYYSDQDAPSFSSTLKDLAAEFTDRMSSHAEVASRGTGLPAVFMLAQAALESGWGKHEIKGENGTSSHNLFGIKASSGWTGKTMDATTTEYINGVKEQRVEKFRAYDSYADSFKDFANLMRNNPRYEKVLANANDAPSYAQAMQSAGYATDPQYAKKLTGVIVNLLGLIRQK